MSDSGARESKALWTGSVYRTLKLRCLDPTRAIADAPRTYVATGQLPPLPDTDTADGLRVT